MERLSPFSVCPVADDGADIRCTREVALKFDGVRSVARSRAVPLRGRPDDCRMTLPLEAKLPGLEAMRRDRDDVEPHAAFSRHGEAPARIGRRRYLRLRARIAAIVREPHTHVCDRNVVIAHHPANTRRVLIAMRQRPWP
jgi:hypothetical protein